MVRKFVHVIEGSGSGWWTPEQLRLVDVVGQVERVQVRLAMLSHDAFVEGARVFLFDGSYDRDDAGFDLSDIETVAAEDVVWEGSPTLIAGPRMDVEVDGLERPFNSGLTPAVEMPAVRAFRLLITVHVRLL